MDTTSIFKTVHVYVFFSHNNYTRVCFMSFAFHAFLRLFLLARDAFVRMNRPAIAMMFVRLFVRLSVCLGRACIVIMLAQI